MGKRGPAPDGKIKVVEFNKRKDPEPPRGMTKRAASLFREIVAGNKADAFDPESIALLRVFCEADNQHFKATNALKRGPAVYESKTIKGDKFFRKNPWFDIQKEAGATMSSVATKLRSKGVVATPEKTGSRRDGLLYQSK